MRVHGVSCLFRFCYGHRIRGHAGGCGHPHGHNARVELECRGPLDRLGMVVDFGEVQARLRPFLDGQWDHRMILERNDPLAAMLQGLGEPVYLMDAPPTAENLARELFRVAREAGLPATAVRFFETDGGMAFYEEA